MAHRAILIVCPNWAAHHDCTSPTTRLPTDEVRAADHRGARDGSRSRQGRGLQHAVLELAVPHARNRRPDALPPTAGARKLIAELQSLPSVKHYSVTHEGAGFKAASIRAVVAGIHTLS